MIRIIGAGFSGLSLAYHFVKRGYSVTIIDKSRRSGGVISSYQTDRMLVETAANGLLSSEKIEQMFADIGLTPLRTRKESRKKYIYRGRIRRWPLSFGETLTLMVKLGFSSCTFRLQPRAKETLQEWGQRVLGAAGDAYLIQPMVNGIFADKTEKLNASLVLGALFYKKKKGDMRGLISAPGGMGEVIHKMEAFLRQQGVRFEWENEVNFEKTDLQHNTFLAINFPNYITVFQPSLSQATFPKNDSLNSLSLLRVTLNFSVAPDQIDGFGILFPNQEGFNSIGVLSNTKIFEHRGVYNESWIFSESTQPDLLKWTDEQVREKIVQDRKRLFQSEFKIGTIVIHRWPNVIPSYNLALKEFLEMNSNENHRISGNFLGVLGLTGIHERNALLVEKYCQNETRTVR